MAGIASFKAISEFIPGLTQYRFTEAKLHGLQHGRGTPVPEVKSPHIRIERQQLDHFLIFLYQPSFSSGHAIWSEAFTTVRRDNVDGAEHNSHYDSK